jgi:DNA-binding MarR family transcriptional regulator
MSSEETLLLRAILSMTARQAFSVDSLLEIVGGGDKQLRAFNMCDGTKTQGDIAKATRIDTGNFSKTLARWVEAGIVLRLGDGRETKLLHVYPLPSNPSKRMKGSK